VLLPRPLPLLLLLLLMLLLMLHNLMLKLCPLQAHALY
jgi:hypothetical protein